ncbi:S41 family peptidase [Stella sp.]|uniref:S41 family peptidase n=1 Tax=Stella sp. TaxID=2912054 RepID=UPI0035ADFB1A
MAGAALVVLGVALSACTQNPLPSGEAADERPDRVFLASLQEVSDLYIDPIDLGTLAITGLNGLTKVAPTFLAARDGDVIRIRDDRRDVLEIPAPPSRNASAWASVMTKALAAARSGQPKIAEAEGDAVYDAVLTALVGGLDRFSRYAGSDVAREQRASRDGFGGIGVTINVENGVVRIVSVIPESPAAMAGVQVDDQILTIDGEGTAKLDQREVVQKLRGRVDSTVRVTVARPGIVDLLEVPITRQRIVVPTIRVDHIGPIAHVRILSFNQQTGRKLVESLEQLMADRSHHVRGIILDLRNNPGGLLDQAVRVADAFLGEGPIIATRGRHPASNQSFEAGARDLVRGIPMVVLINGGSASAAEIVAAALQDRGRAVVVGSASYGKGTVQTVMRLPNDGELTLTWARLLSPAGYALHEHGVIPTICTNGMVDDAASLRVSLQKESRTLGPGGVNAVPRAQLDDAGWRALRAACTGQSREQDVDVKLAERLLTDGGLFQRALRLSQAAVGTPRIGASLADRRRTAEMRP